MLIAARCWPWGGQSGTRSHIDWRTWNNWPSTFNTFSLFLHIPSKLDKEIPSLLWWDSPLLPFSFLAQQPKARRGWVHGYRPLLKLEHLVLYLVASFQKPSRQLQHTCAREKRCLLAIIRPLTLYSAVMGGSFNSPSSPVVLKATEKWRCSNLWVHHTTASNLGQWSYVCEVDAVTLLTHLLYFSPYGFGHFLAHEYPVFGYRGEI